MEQIMAEPKITRLAKAKAQLAEANAGFYMPNYYDKQLEIVGLVPEKLIVPKDYKSVVQMCYDFYNRGGSVGRVIDRLQEFTITDIRNGQRNTSDEVNAYFYAVLHDKPSRLLRFLRMAALEYYLSGMVLPKIEWKELPGKEICPDLKPNKLYMVPVFDLYPPLLIDVEWRGWGKKGYFLKIPESDIKTIRNKGGEIKEQQLKYQYYADTFPYYVDLINKGETMLEIRDVDPILRKETSISPYPTPYLYSVLEALVFKQQLRRMDFAVAARVVNAILLVQEGNDAFPMVEDSDTLNENLANLQNQILGRMGDPRKIERLFALFTNHTTKISWISPDVEALLNQDKYRQTNEELDEGLGFPGILLTGTARQGASTSEISTWAIQPQMEELRSMFIEWLQSEVYYKGAELNNFRKQPVPAFKPIKLQDFVKTAAVFAALYKEGNISRTTRDEMSGIDFETEAELMKDEAEIAKGLPAYTPTPYSPPPPMIGQNPGRPIGSQNVPVNNRNSGVKPSGQTPISRVRAEISSELSDEELLNLMNTVANENNIYITIDDLLNQ